MGSYREFKKEAILTKRYFVEVADILVKHDASDDMIWDFADYFERSNPKFDSVRFMDYIDSKQKEISVEPSAELNEEIEEGGLNV